jgi:hypothetical protein
MRESDEQYVLSQLGAGLQEVVMRTPASAVLIRGRALRRRRRLPATSVAILAIGASIGLGVGAGHGTAAIRPGPRSTTVLPRPMGILTAWTVRKKTDGVIEVTVRQMKDIAGLETALRSDGVPVVVTASMAIPDGCAEFADGNYQMGDVITNATQSGLPDANGTEFSIRASVIPASAVLWIGLAQSGAPAGSSGPAGPMATAYFAASVACGAN